MRDNKKDMFFELVMTKFKNPKDNEFKNRGEKDYIFLNLFFSEKFLNAIYMAHEQKLEEELSEKKHIIDMLENMNKNNNNMQYLTEELLTGKMSENEKISKYIKELKEAGSVKGNLTVIDPYFFASDNKDYIENIKKILKECEASSVNFITDEKNYKISAYKSIKVPNCKCTIEFKNDFHDRFWLCENNGEKKGFLSGTSLNGIGKKIFVIKKLDNEEIKELFTEIQKKSRKTSNK